MYRILDEHNKMSPRWENEFYQWDSDRKLVVLDASVEEVHFTNRAMENALVKTVYKDEETGYRLVDVPNILFQSYKAILVYGYDKDSKCTTGCTAFKVNKRKKPDDYVYTETEVFKYSELEERITQLEEREVEVDLSEYYTKDETEDYVNALFERLNSNVTLGFYCVEDVTIVLNNVSTTYPANSNVEIKLLDTDNFEIIPTSDYSILTLNAFPGALRTYYSWLEGVKQFSNILFDMNSEDMYSKWSQGNQGSYQVQYAQYTNCIFWSDNSYISDVSKRTNYTLYYTSQLPLCYSSIPDNTFKSFYLAFNVNSDPNWGNKAYRDSFAKATWATQVFSYYGARTIGIFGHDDPDFNIVLPKDCRGLMYQSTAIENAGTFDAINTTNFGATGSSWQQAFGQCSSLRNLYIKNLTVNLNVSWSPINYQSIYFIISKAANTKAITISVSPYTYNLLGPTDFELATSKSITIKLVTTNYVEDRRLSAIGDGVGWFQGGLKVGGTGYDDPEAKQVATVDPDAVVFKKITFTDRPSLISWLDANYSKAIQADVKIGSMGVNLNCQLGQLQNEDGAVGSYSLYQTRWVIYDSFDEMRTTIIELDNDRTTYSVSSRIYIYDDETGLTGKRYSTPTVIPDESWSNMGISATFLYYE